MKIWKILSPRTIVEEERPDNISAPTQAKVKITKVLLAYPEIRAFTGASGVRLPRVPGMFAVGVVTEAGEGCVKAEKNARVFINGTYACGECSACRRGNADGCLSPVVAGEDCDGFLRDFAVCEEAHLFPLPPSVSDNEALFTGVVSLCEGIVDKLDVPKGTHVAVVGAGVTGIILSQLLIYHQAVPVLIDADEEKLSVAAKCGIYYTFKADEELMRNLNEVTGGRMAEGCVFTSFCGLPDDLPFAITAKRGKVIYAGMEFPEMSVHLKKALDKELCVLGATRDYAQCAGAINLLVNKAVDFKPLTAEETNAADIPALFNAKAQLWEKEKRAPLTILDMI